MAALPDLKGMTQDELEAFASGLHEPRFRGRQLAYWIYRQGAGSFAEMTDLPQALRVRLPQLARLTVLTPVTAVEADRGDTIKFLFALDDGATVETVFMRYEDGRRSLCISTQVGCGMGCTFCATGLAGLVRNLSAAEIVDQVVRVQRLIDERVSHVVFMGMGEPLANYGPTVRAVRLLNAPYAAGIGMRHLTVSTVGLVPQIRRLAREQLQLTLAVSLHAPTDALRDQLVPINRRWPLAELLAACREYVTRTGRRVSFEYVLMEGVNDAPDLAVALATLLRRGAPRRARPLVDTANHPGVGPWHVNLIPWNPVYGLQYQRPAAARVEAFARALRGRGIPTTVRVERGVEIDAACGQLRRTHAETTAAGAGQPSDPLPNHGRGRNPSPLRGANTQTRPVRDRPDAPRPAGRRIAAGKRPGGTRP